MQPSLFELLSCPKCSGTLTMDAKTCVCRTCNHQYPTIDGIPWLFAASNESLAQWRDQLNALLQTIQKEADEIKNDLRLPGQMDLTVRRLRKLLQAKVEQHKLIADLLDPISSARGGSLDFSIATKAKLPKSQNLLSYYTNIHRDWVWGHSENEASIQCIDDLIADDRELDSLLIAGAGSCRLLYDVVERYAPKITIGLDINPLLLLAAKKILSGRTVKLYEFPIAPTDMESYAVLQKCKAQKKLEGNYHLLFGDSMDLPIRSGSLSTVITPWFIDIIPESPETFFAKINWALRPGGRWLNFGSLVYQYKNPAQDFSAEEILTIAELSGFAIEKCFTRKIPYMQSPLSNHGRIEGAFCFTARKVRNVAEPKRGYSVTPPWLVNLDDPVPSIPDFVSLTNVYKIYLDVLLEIDGKKSIRDIATRFGPKYQMNALDAEQSIVRFLSRTFQESRGGR